MSSLERVPPFSLLDKIIKANWREVNEELVSEVLAKKQEMVPFLADLVKDKQYWNVSGYDSWAPITAIHLLSLSKEKQALDALIYVLCKYPEELGDWLTEDMPSLLSYFGVDAFESLKNIILDRRVYQWSRNAAARAIMVVADKSGDKNLRAQAIECLKEAIRNEKDFEARSFFVFELSEMKDGYCLPFFKSLFDAGMVDPKVTSYSEIEELYAGRYDDTIYLVHDTKDPMDYFREGTEIRRSLSEVYDEKEKTRSSLHSAHGQKKKVGRNDPCPCGSGKKYKKCCLKKK